MSMKSEAAAIIRAAGYKRWTVESSETLVCPHGDTIEWDGSCPSGCVSPLIELGDDLMPDEYEVWTAPDGRQAHLVPVTLPIPDDPQWEPWFAESPGQRPPQSYEMRSTVTGEALRADTVFPVEPWSPYDAISDRLTREGWTSPPPTAEELAQCEHGLSAMLCAGPGHYPQEGF